MVNTEFCFHFLKSSPLPWKIYVSFLFHRHGNRNLPQMSMLLMMILIIKGIRKGLLSCCVYWLMWRWPGLGCFGGTAVLVYDTLPAVRSWFSAATAYLSTDSRRWSEYQGSTLWVPSALYTLSHESLRCPCEMMFPQIAPPRSPCQITWSSVPQTMWGHTKQC